MYTRIEDLNRMRLSKSSDEDLIKLRLRFIQLWDKNFKNSESAVVGRLNRNDFLKRYKLLLDELKARQGLAKGTSDIDKAVFKKAMTMGRYGIDVPDLEDIILVSDYVVIDAEFAKSDEAGVIIKEDIELEDVKTALSKVIKNQIEKTCEFDIDVLPDVHIPLYDLVLVVKGETMRVEMEKVDISKPYPNEHSARLQSPDKFDKDSFRRTKGGTIYGSKKVPSTISIIWAKLKGKAKPSDPPIAQALRFLTKSWTVAEAKKWLKDNNITFTLFEPAEKVAKKIWTARFINNLPDSAFLYIAPDGEKDDEGKTKLRKLRFLPYKDADGKIDLPHLRNALARIPQTKLSVSIKAKLRTKAEELLEEETEEKEKKFEKFVPVYPIDKADSEEHVVCGVVYEPDVVDAQGDEASETEIRKAAYQFMEEVQTFKVNHEGKKVKVKVLESYVAPADFTIAKKAIKKGAWVLTVRVLDKKIWEAVKSGDLTGFSMAGYARAE